MNKKPVAKSIEVIHVGPDIAAKGGIATSISLLKEHMNDKDVRVLLVSTINPDLSGFTNYWSFFKTIFIFSTKLIFRKPDIIHIHMASRGSFFRKSILSLLCLVFRTPYIIHLHGGGFKDFYHGLWGFSKSYLRFIFKKSAVIITLSDFWREWVLAELKADQVVVVHNGVNQIEFSSDELNKNTPTVLFLGLLGKNKGTDVLIEAMRQVNITVPDAVLELCGNGDIDLYRQQAHDLPNVRFHGWISDHERRAALARATVYCLPSWKEGLPFSILEAMSAGLPVISTPVGSILEALVDGVNGYLVQPGDIETLAEAIIRLLRDPCLASKMGAAGKEIHRKKFSLSIMAEGCLEAYRAALCKT